MTREELEAFAKKHTFAIIAVGGGALITLILIMRNKGGSSKATLDTVHTDLGQIDFDINQLSTNFNTSGNAWTSTVGSPMSGSTSSGQPNPPYPPLTPNVYTTKTGDTLGSIVSMEYGVHDKAQGDPLIREVLAANPKFKSWNWAKAFPVGTQLTIPDINPIPSGRGPSGSVGMSQAKERKGKGPVGAYIPDSPPELWSMVGAADLVAIFDTWHQSEQYSLPGDYSDYANLN